MSKSVASFLSMIWFLLLFGIGTSSPAAVTAVGGIELTPLDASLVSRYQKYDGKIVGEIHFSGLVRTKETAARWLMKTAEGKPFDSSQLAVDIQRLYNTTVLYDIGVTVRTADDNPDALIIAISVNDKWTLLPFAGAQGGGGSLTYGGGLFDNNLFGYFIQGTVQLYNYNGQLSYGFNLYQEYVMGSPIMASFDISRSVTPTIIYNIDGSSAGNYSWFRQQEEFMVGSHFKGPVRLMVYADTYFDGMLSETGVNAFTYSGLQYKLHPKVIIGRANILEFLEEGQEITLHPSAANFFGPVTAYQGMDASYKYVKILSHGGNFGFNIFGGAMSVAPPPYEYEVGGYSNLRGYANDREVGPYVAVTSVEYRPMLYKTRFSPLGIDLDWVVLQGCLFSDFGSAWGDSTLTGDPGSAEFRPLWSAGAGVRLNFLHFAGAIMRLDLARTINPDEGWGLSFGVGQFF